jgi:hypothetical protein
LPSAISTISSDSGFSRITRPSTSATTLNGTVSRKTRWNAAADGPAGRAVEEVDVEVSTFIT